MTPAMRHPRSGPITAGLGAGLLAEGWAHRYPGRAHPALAEVSFRIPPGALVVLMGASGSGKSTLLAALAGTLPEGTGAGRLVLDGAPGVGLVQQEPESNIVMERVGDDLALPLENRAVAPGAIWPRVRASLADVGLDVALEAPTGRLSGGQQQLLAIAAATIAEPGLLLLDEPTANLDPAAAAAVLRAVEEVRERTGCTVVVVEHRVEPWLARASHVLLAAQGTVTPLAPSELAVHLAADPATAGRVWVDHRHLRARHPIGPPGPPVLLAEGIALAGRLAPIDLTVRSGEVLALTGAPGSGKSTLLACLGGLLEPTAGSVRAAAAGGWRGDPWRWSSAEVAATFGIVFQDPEHQFVAGSVVDELRHGLGEAADPAARVDGMLERLHLGHLAGVDPFTLSGGEQRRLSVGTALIRDPGLLLLDEPTFGQDPTTWAEVVDIVAEHRDAGGAVVLATHDPSLVEALAARELRLQPVLPLPSAAPDGQPARLHGLRGLDPLALLVAAVLCSVAALVSGSVLANLALVGLVTVAAVLGRVGARRVALLGIPAGIAALSVGWSNALLSDAGPGSPDAWAAAALPASRVLAVALPGLVAAVALDPTRLADALVARLRVPARAAYAALAGLRLLPLLADEWRTLERASRARGLGGRGLVDRARRFGSITFRLLVGALRRAGRLAVALEVRGLHSATPRTCARPVRWRWSDTAVVVAGALALAATITLT